MGVVPGGCPPHLRVVLPGGGEAQHGPHAEAGGGKLVDGLVVVVVVAVVAVVVRQWGIAVGDLLQADGQDVGRQRLLLQVGVGGDDHGDDVGCEPSVVFLGNQWYC